MLVFFQISYFLEIVMKKFFVLFVIAIFCLVGLNSCAGVMWTEPYRLYYTPYRPYHYHVPPPRHHRHHHSPRHHCQVFDEMVDVEMFGTLA